MDLGSIERADEAQRAIALALLARIERQAPSLRKSVKWGHLVLSGNKDIFSIMPTGQGDNAHVNLQLFRGGEFSSKSDLIEGTGKLMRHVKFHTLSDVERGGVDAVIEGGIAVDGALA